MFFNGEGFEEVLTLLAPMIYESHHHVTLEGQAFLANGWDNLGQGALPIPLPTIALDGNAQTGGLSMNCFNVPLYSL